MRQIAKVVFWFCCLVFLAQGLQAKESVISLAFVGDVMLARGVGRQMLNHGIDYPFTKVKNVLTSADIAFANLEGALTGDRVTGSSSAFIFCSPGYFAQSLVSSGIDIVSLANNHANDGGGQGVINTMEILRKVGVKYVGAGQDYQEARSLRIIEVKGQKIGFLAYTDLANIGLAQAAATNARPGVASAQSKAVFADLQTARKKVDLLIVSFHWGSEYQIGEPNQRQKTLAYQCIAYGADIVIGHHPHVLQKVEVYGGKTIAYSMGNFVFDNHKPSRAKTMILWIDWHLKTGRQQIKEIPCYIKNCRPEIVN